METKYNEATHNRPEGDRAVDAPVVLIDLPDFIKQIKHEKAWKENDRNAITVFKTEKMRIVLVALHKKALMTTDQPKNVMSLQVIKGKIKLHATSNSCVLNEKHIVALHDHIAYKVEALKKSIFLLTMAE